MSGWYAAPGVLDTAKGSEADRRGRDGLFRPPLVVPTQQAHRAFTQRRGVPSKTPGPDRGLGGHDRKVNSRWVVSCPTTIAGGCRYCSWTGCWRRSTTPGSRWSGHGAGTATSRRGRRHAGRAPERLGGLRRRACLGRRTDAVPAGHRTRHPPAARGLAAALVGHLTRGVMACPRS